VSPKTGPFRLLTVLANNRPLQVLWFGDLISVFGNVATSVALPLYTLQLTGSPGLMGLAVAVQWVPGLFVRLLAGVLIDRTDRRKLLICVSLLQALPPLAIVLVKNLPLLYLVIFLAGMLQQVVFPALFSVLPQVAGKDNLLPANALFSASRTFSQILGASLAGVIVGFWGAKWVFFLDAFSFVIFGLLLLGLPGLPASPGTTRRRLLADLRAGLVFAVSQPTVRAICVLALLGMFLVSSSAMAMVVLCTRQWGVGAVGYGVLSTAGAVGALAASVSVGSWGDRFAQTRLVVGGFLIKCLSILALGLIPVYALALPVRVLVGGAMPVWNVPLDAYLQKNVAPDMLGRVYSLTGISVSLGTVLGSLTGGPVAEYFGPRALLLGAGLVAATGLALVARLLRPIDVREVKTLEAQLSAGG